jgi:hypothetical protein
MKSFILKSCLFVMLLVASSALYAQPAGTPPGGPSGGSNPPCWPPPCIPVDGGISVLIAIGAAYGSKKAYDFYKTKDDAEA